MFQLGHLARSRVRFACVRLARAFDVRCIALAKMATEMLRSLPGIVANDNSGTVTFEISEPFHQALRTVRSAIDPHRLRIVSELDVSRRVERHLALRLPGCIILYIWPGPTLVPEIPVCAALFLPLHIIVSERGLRTSVHVPVRIPVESGDQDVLDAICATQRETVLSMEAIAMRVSLV